MKGVLKDQKQKFINIIEEIQDCGAIGDSGMLYKSCNNKQLAETLIANNAIVLPAKLGSEVYAVVPSCGVHKHARFCSKRSVEKVEFTLDLAEGWGKYVFATKEEAEKMQKR